MAISQNDWSLHRKGPADQQRHKEKIKDALKRNLQNIISEESIILSDGKKVIRVPIRSLEEYKFRFDPRKHKNVGQGQGGSKVGDVIGQQGQPQDGQGAEGEAGVSPGIDYYEADVTLDEIEGLIFEDLVLPNLQEKQHQQLESEGIRFKDIRKTGILTNLDKKRTIRENIKRNATKGDPHFKEIRPEDLRYKTWEPDIRTESNAVVIAMMDVSGSMGDFEKYIARSFYFWMVRFLRTKYNNVEIVFISHHTEAKLVGEEEFFTKGESGGTKASSAYRLALNVIREKYNPAQWNIYPFHFSDGDNQLTDNELCVELVKQLIDQSNLFGYGEIKEYRWAHSSTLMSAFSKIQDEKFVGVTIEDKKDVYAALRKFFAPREVIAGGN
ncbi:MAG TPA: sporulation protein YhbH [Armatimonadota bacterium]|nr:sporulation protein YhbH [Armatimonadota bacterium]